MCLVCPSVRTALNTRRLRSAPISRPIQYTLCVSTSNSRQAACDLPQTQVPATGAGDGRGRVLYD